MSVSVAHRQPGPGVTGRKIVVVGGGLGGLASACTLAARGHSVRLLEANAFVGGKAAVLKQDGFRFDMGPTIVTVPAVLERIFAECGRRLPELLEMRRLDPQWRCFFEDGSVHPCEILGRSIGNLGTVDWDLSRLWSSPEAAARAARQAELVGPVLFGSLSRYTVAHSGLLLVRLDLWLVDPAGGAVLWSGTAQRPVPVRSALTAEEIVLDAAPRIYADAFGSG